MTMQRRPFHKGYIGNWSEEIFKVADRMLTVPVTYKLKDLAGEDIKGAFYEDELQSVMKAEDDLFDIERILKTRKRAGKVEYFVKWRGYPAKFNSWVIALTELSVLAIFDNVLKNKCYIKLLDEHTDTVEHPSEIYIVREGYYHTVYSLVYELRMMLVLLGISLEMDMDRVVLQNDGNYNVHFNRTLMDKLGFVDIPVLGFERGRHTAENPGDMAEQTVPTLFVYCDILQYVVVGNIMAPLLRMVDMKRKRTYGKMQETLAAPLYVPLQKKHFDTIEINIMTDTGEPVHFAHRKSVTVLEFKRIGLLDKVI